MHCAFVYSVAYYLGLVGQNDKDGVRQRIYDDPLSILEYLKTANVILNQQSNGPHVGMGLEAKSEVWLRTGRVEANSDVLVEFPDNFLNARRWQP